MPSLVVGKQLSPSFSILTDEAEKLHYWNELIKYWQPTHPTHFPGCNPISLSRVMLNNMQKDNKRYSIALKSDGVRYVLFATTRPSSTPENIEAVALMIDRAKNMYEVDIMAPKDVFTKGTIMEGELVWKQPDEHNMVFLMFDCILSRGKNLCKQSFSARYKELERNVRLSDELAFEKDLESRVLETNNIAMLQYSPKITLRMKTFVSARFAEQLWNDRREAGHRVDGLIIHDDFAHYCFGTAFDRSICKWKEKSTIDLAGRQLMTQEGPMPRVVGPELGSCKVVVDESRIVADGPNDVVEYVLINDTANRTIHLFAMRTRIDKVTPNSLKVVLATIQDVIDNISPSEIANIG